MQSTPQVTKPRQLKIASALGFKVPKTLISNSPEAVEKFQLECGQVIAKPLFSGDIQYENEMRVVFATLVTHNDLSAKKNIRLAPTIFQEYVGKDLELRVTVIGNKVLAASINSQEVNDALHDWRKASPGSLCFRPYKLPTSVSDKCVQLVATLGLTFGTIDMVKTQMELRIPRAQSEWAMGLVGDSHWRPLYNNDSHAT